MPRIARDVVFVDGVRTPFGKAGPNGLYAETRADDMVVSVIRELLRRNPALPPERIGDVAIAATTQTGDQGLTIGRSSSRITLTTMSSALVSAYRPFGPAFPNGARTPSTKTTSRAIRGTVTLP